MLSPGGRAEWEEHRAMIRREPRKDRVRTTFAVADPGRPVSVVGDFNGWDPLAHPMRKRSNGTRSVAVELVPGERYRFRYLADGGEWIDDPSADAHEANGYGGTHSVLIA
jgi:1,4-alpha-glucan branching enzyme